jgi:hypothetical protein
MKKVLIKTYGFIGDILFASSVAEKLHQQYDNVEVDFCIGFPQPYKLLQNNPYINQVFLSKHKGPRVTIPDSIQEKDYTDIYEQTESLHNVQPTVLFQEHCRIENTTPEFTIYTEECFDRGVQYELAIHNTNKLKIVGYVANWNSNTVRYTKEEYLQGLLNPQLVLAHTHTNTRDTDYIINQLSKEFLMIPLGYSKEVTQYHGALETVADYTNQASIIKCCDLVIGQEGGMTNLAAGVGTRCAITTDFMNALYGPKGIMRQLNSIQLGPKNLFPNRDHIHFDPYSTDEEILNIIKSIL